MRFGSICSGIEAASVAWHGLGWQASWLAEIDVPASLVLAHRLGATAPKHMPSPLDNSISDKERKSRQTALKRIEKEAWGDRITNWGDFTRLPEAVLAGEADAVDLLCGGTPCQSYSIAGRREGLEDSRGQLTLKFVELADAIDTKRAERGEPPCVVFWENVPGVLSSKDNAFGCFLADLAGEDLPLEPPGGRWSNAGAVLGPKRAIAWIVKDAQYFGVAQRRARVFVVASAREGFDPAAVLFEFDGVRRDSAPSRETGEDVAGTLASRTDGGGFPGTDEACSGYVQPVERPRSADLSVIAMAHGQGGAEISVDRCPTLTCNHEAPIAAIPIDMRQASRGATMTNNRQPGTSGGAPGTGIGKDGDPCPTISGSHPPAIAIPILEAGARTGVSTTDPRAGIGIGQDGDPMFTLQSSKQHAVALSVALRGREGGATAELGDDVAGTLRASGGGDKPHVLAFSCKDYGADATLDLAPTMRAMGHDGSHANAGGQLAVCVTGDITHTLTAEGFDASEDGTGRGQPIIAFSNLSEELCDACAQEADSASLLRAMRGEVGAETSTEWRFGVSDPLQQAEVLRSALYGSELRRASDKDRSQLDDSTSSCSENMPSGPVRGVCVTCGGSSSHRRELAEQRPEKSDASLQILPHQSASQTGMAVRRLMPVEAERLQGFEDNWTLVPSGKGLAADGPRYKQLGNSWAVPCVTWIGARIDAHVRDLDARQIDATYDLDLAAWVCAP